MWNYDKTLDIYRNTDDPDYYVEVNANKVFPAWKTFSLCHEKRDTAHELISTSMHSALDEAALLLERLKNGSRI